MLTPKRVMRAVLAANMVGIGLLHFVAGDIFIQIVPPFLPWPLALVWISGACEIALGVLLLPPVTRRYAGLLLVALYVAVFPANIYMAMNNVQVNGLPTWLTQPSQLALWLRLPVQLGLINWALWVSKPDRTAAAT